MTTLVTVGGQRSYPGHVPNAPVARRLVARLLDAGEPVRILTVPEEADRWPPAAEVVVGDVARPDDTPVAFDRIDRLFLAGAVPETARRATTLATAGGARHIVVLSSHGPDVEIEFEPDSWYWLAVEVVVERSGVPWTHLQPAPLMGQTAAPGFPDVGSDLAAAIRGGTVVRESDPDEPYPLIDEDDLAAVAEEALCDDRYARRTLTVHGAPVSLREEVALIGQALGRRIPVEPLTPEQLRDRYRAAGVSQEEVDAWADDTASTDAGDAVGSDAVGSGTDWMAAGVATLTEVLGRPPRSYADWLADNLDLFR